MYVLTYICMYVYKSITYCSLLIATICFNESSISVDESQESLIFTMMISDPLSTDLMVTVFTTSGTATGELNITVCMYVHITHIHSNRAQ